jgi:D-alanyl-D-alanine carboxypeptidase (penicillin-binding protein 5/6)
VSVVLFAAPVGVWAAEPSGTRPDLPGEGDLPIALLVDVTSNQVLYARNPERRFVPASVTKVMTLYCAFELLAAGKLRTDQALIVSEESARDWNGTGSTMWLRGGDEVPLRDLLTGIATVSANDASIVLADRAGGSLEGWSRRMNETARALGMTQSHFASPNGFPDEGQTFTTARDLAILGEAIIRRHPHLYARFIGREQFSYAGIVQDNRDPMIGQVEGADGIKTGYTSEAGYTYLGSAERNGQRLIVAIGGANRSTVRAQAARELIEWGFAAFDLEQLYEAGDVVGRARVQNGAARSIDLLSDRPVRVNVPRGQGDRVRLSITYEGPLRAPVKAGEAIATLVISAPGMEPARVPLLAAQDVGQAGFFARIGNAIAGWWERVSR